MKGEHYFREQDRAHEKQIERTRRKLDRVAQKLPTLNEAIEQRDLWAKQCNYASERAAAAEVKITDLAMLVRRLSRFAPPQQAAQALDYLKRHGLEGSPLRDDAPFESFERRDRLNDRMWSDLPFDSFERRDRLNDRMWEEGK
jgi:hypothetical protein